MEQKKPKFLFITCCDNRIIPYSFAKKVIPSLEEGDLFILRNIGNIIPPADASENSVGAAIEFAIGYLNIKQIIVCGHSDCRAMKAALKRSKDLPERTAISSRYHLPCWIKYSATIDQTTEKDEFSKKNVLHQIENLKTYKAPPSTAKGDTFPDIATITIHAWWLDLKPDTEDNIYFYNYETKRWLKK